MTLKRFFPDKAFARQHLAILLFLGVCTLGLVREALYEVRKVDTPLGFAIDDAWIHASLARSLIRGEGFGINPGEWVPASTAPAWTISLAVVMLIFRDPVISGLLLSTLYLIASVILMYFLMFRFTRNRFWSAFSSLSLLLHPILLWGGLSGMEHPVVVLSILISFMLYEVSEPDSRLRLVGFPLSLVLCALSRPELFLLAPAGLAATFYQNAEATRASWIKGFRFGVGQGLIFLAGMLPYFLFNYLTTHHLFPTAFFVKAQLRDVGIASMVGQESLSQLIQHSYEAALCELINTFKKFMAFDVVYLMLFPVGALSLAQPTHSSRKGRALLMLALTILLPLAEGITTPAGEFSNYANRYLTPYVPAFLLLGSLGFWYIWEIIRVRVAAVLLLIPCIFLIAEDVKPILGHYAHDVKNTNVLYVDSGKWLNQNLPPDMPLAVNDIGGISYFADQPMVDIMGLGSPEIWPYLQSCSRQNRILYVLQYMQDHGIDHLVVSPKYYPQIRTLPGVFEVMHQWDAAFPTGRSIDPQILYRIHWDLFPGAPGPVESDG